MFQGPGFGDTPVADRRRRPFEGTGELSFLASKLGIELGVIEVGVSPWVGLIDSAVGPYAISNHLAAGPEKFIPSAVHRMRPSPDARGY